MLANILPILIPSWLEHLIWKEAVEGIGELEYQSRLAQETYPHGVVIGINLEVTWIVPEKIFYGIQRLDLIPLANL
jgi:hypothetical protein